MIINIKPVDVLFFRDSKPFGRGSEHFTKSIFPPFSQTLYGALRTTVLEKLGCDYDTYKTGNVSFSNTAMVEKAGLEKIIKELGTPNQFGDFTLKGPFLLHNGESVFIRVPSDIKKIEDSDELCVLAPFDWKRYGISTDLKELECFFPHTIKEKRLKDINGYMSISSFTEYSLGVSIKTSDIKSTDEIFNYEMRTGLGINRETNVSEEGLLYTMGFVRLKDCNKDQWSLCAEVKDFSLLSKRGFIKLGGANRVCEYEEISDNPFKYYYDITHEIKKIVQNTKKFKLIFLTPALFKKGWLSERFNDNFELEIYGIKIKLISVCLNKPEVVSGWDLANQKPKHIKKVVPSGSVYYFELSDNSEDAIDKIFDYFLNNNFSDENEKTGFGTVLIGGINV
ncbi:MAG: type III-B CRISPR module-associated protein Cmr3 [bacterium]|nr:type III-B CRISPR module-associated protein Cmr3 [bacterium]